MTYHVTETCSCGASFQISGSIIDVTIKAWREGHRHSENGVQGDGVVVRELRDLIGAKSFGVLVPGAREKDPTHNGWHDVVLVSDLKDLIDHATTDERNQP